MTSRRLAVPRSSFRRSNMPCIIRQMRYQFFNGFSQLPEGGRKLFSARKLRKVSGNRISGRLVVGNNVRHISKAYLCFCDCVGVGFVIDVTAHLPDIFKRGKGVRRNRNAYVFRIVYGYHKIVLQKIFRIFLFLRYKFPVLVLYHRQQHGSGFASLKPCKKPYLP